MDVTRLTGALRAAEDRAPGAREASPGFETFLPADERAPSRRADGDRSRLVDDARAVEQSERRRADAERIRERRDAEREGTQRAARRREAERADDDRRARRAEDADGRPLTARDPEPKPKPPPTERPAAEPRAAESRAARDPSRGEAPEATDDDPAPLAGAQGLGGLVEWLRSHVASERHAGAAQAAPDDGVLAERAIDGAGPAGGPPTNVAEAPDAPEAEFARLLEGRKLTDALSAQPRRAGDSVRLGPRPSADVLPAAPAAIAATRITGAGVAARAGVTPTALPEGVDESSIMRQISDALRLRGGRAGKAQTADIQLHPAELGRVRIRIHMEHGAARVRVSAEHAAVGDLLGAGLDQLRRDLMAHGVQIAHLEVDSGLTEDREQGRDTPEHDEADERELPPEGPRPTARRPRGRIDLEA